MKPQEKMNWFWATGVLPGTIFDDFDDKKPRENWRWRRARHEDSRQDAGRDSR